MFKPLSRRTVLRGLGAGMALPMLESMTPVYGTDKLAKPPIRAAFIFMPNGVWPKDWDPAGQGEKFEANTPFLKNFENVKEECTLLQNLWNANSKGRNGHWPKVPAFLGGGYVERSTVRNLGVGRTSVDQVMAREIGHKTSLPSLELGIDEPRSGIDSVGGGFTRLYGNHISWRGPRTPVASERIPLYAFNRLFKSGKAPKIPGLKPDTVSYKESMLYDSTSVLDLVREEAKSLQRKISRDDREKIDEYFETVRAIELQISNSMIPQKRWVNQTKFEFTRPEAGIPENHEAHVRLMLDILLLAFWTDSTRISTFMLGNAQSKHDYSFLPGVKGTFHELSHHREKTELLKQYKDIVHYNLRQVSYVMEKMKSMNEGQGNLLDNSMLLFGSTIKDGNNHQEHDLPLILAGKAQGKIQSGKIIKSPEKTPLNNLYVSMLNVMGIKRDKIGDSTGKIDLA